MQNMLNYFGQVSMPGYFSQLASIGITDSMNILSSQVIDDGAGGQITNGETAINATPIDCICSPVNIESKSTEGARASTITQEYEIRFPAVHDGAAIELKPGNRLEVLERGLQPARIFEIDSWQHIHGSAITAICKLEN